MRRILMGCLLLLALLAGCADKEDGIEPAASGEQDTAIKPQTEELVPTGFKNQVLTKDGKSIYVNGNAKAENGAFYYKVETQEGKERLPEKKVELEHPHAYLPYEFTLDRDKISDEDVSILKMYGKDGDGKVTNPNYFPLDPKDMDEK